MSRLRLTPACLLFLVVEVLLGSQPALAGAIADDSAACQGGSSTCKQHWSTYSYVGLSEGNASESYSAVRITSAFGPTLTFDLTYNSYNADATRTSIDAGMGYGWTHTYNDFLFKQGDNIFRMGPDGRVIKFSPLDGSYKASRGYFETLVVDSDASFTITAKNQSKYHYELIPATHFAMDGQVFRLTRITDRNHNVTTLTYSAGDLTTITDTYARSLVLAYDANHHLASVTDPAGGVTTFGYASDGSLLTAITDPLGKTTTYTYNNLRQITGKYDGDERMLTILYESNRPYSEVDANGTTLYALSNTSNWANNPVTITGPDGTATTYKYDPNTLEIASITDANGNTTSYKYDPGGNPIQVTDAGGKVRRYTYEPVFNQMTSMTDSSLETTTYTYDGNGNRLSETDALGKTRHWTYDSHGNILTDTDKNDNTTSYFYDGYGNRIPKFTALNGKSCSHPEAGSGPDPSNSPPTDHPYWFQDPSPTTIIGGGGCSCLTLPFPCGVFSNCICAFCGKIPFGPCTCTCACFGLGGGSSSY
jgi:YD repeat-containing protein